MLKIKLCWVRSDSAPILTYQFPIYYTKLAKYCPPYIYFTWLNQTDIFVNKNLSIFSFELFHSSISDEFDSFTFMNLIKRWSQIKQS